MRIVWITDPHLNFLDQYAINEFLKSVNEKNADLVVITGDISDGLKLKNVLFTINNNIDVPVYFNLGNHDFYHSSRKEILKMVIKACKKSDRLNWFGVSGVIPLTDDTCIIGEDCIGDAKNGDFQLSLKTGILLNDYRLIRDFSKFVFIGDYIGLEKELNRIGEESGKIIKTLLEEACQKFKNIMLFTHVPPFASMCRYQEDETDLRWTPHYSCKSAGDIILKIMNKYPDCYLEVYSGHIHTYSKNQISKNIMAIVGKAEYYNPIIQGVINI